MREPRIVEVNRPLASAENKEIVASIDWIIVSNGPGSWASDAYWDEYLISVHNPLAKQLTITGIEVYDSKQSKIIPQQDRKSLVRASKKVLSEYEDANISVAPGMGSGELLAAGGALTVTGVGVVAAAASTVAPYAGASAGASMAAVVGVGMVLSGPVVAGFAIVRANNNSKVNREIGARRAVLPLDVGESETLKLHFFFPIAVSPSHVILRYIASGKIGQLQIDTREELMGLHLMR